MKQLFLIVFLAMQVGGAHAAKQYRDFTDTQGRTIRGCVLAYNVKTGVVSFERSNRRTAKVPLSVFSEESQGYIQSWLINKDFVSKSSFKIQASKRTDDNEKESFKNRKESRKAEDIHYEISLKNSSTQEFKDLTVEYCIYYEQQESNDNDAKAFEKGVLYGKISTVTMPPKSEKKVKTEPVILFKNELNPDWNYVSNAQNIQRGKVTGIWIRVRKTLPSGETLIREYSLPDKLIGNVKWEKRNIKAGLN